MSDETQATPENESGETKKTAAKDEAAKKDTIAAAAAITPDMTALGHVPVEVQVVLGRMKLPISQVLKLGRGAVVEIDRKVGEQVEIHINHRPVAKGEIVIVDDDRLGVTLTEIVSAPSALH